MKLKHIIENIKKEKQFESNIWLPGFSQNVFGYDGFDSNNFNDEHHEQERLKSYYYKMWYCTDSYVGEKVYFLDDKPVAISSQYGRKSEEDVEWLSLEAYNSVKEYVKTFIEEEVKTIETLDLEQEIPDTYNLSFYDELFDFHKKRRLLQWYKG